MGASPIERPIVSLVSVELWIQDIGKMAARKAEILAYRTSGQGTPEDSNLILELREKIKARIGLAFRKIYEEIREVKDIQSSKGLIETSERVIDIIKDKREGKSKEYKLSRKGDLRGKVDRLLYLEAESKESEK